MLAQSAHSRAVELGSQFEMSERAEEWCVETKAIAKLQISVAYLVAQVGAEGTKVAEDSRRVFECIITQLDGKSFQSAKGGNQLGQSRLGGIHQRKVSQAAHQVDTTTQFGGLNFETHDVEHEGGEAPLVKQ